MSVAMILGLAVALTIFFLGIILLKSSLKWFEPHIGPFLRKALDHPIIGVLVGCLSAAVIQSSSATNAIAVSFVAAGVLGLPHAFSIMLGANIGTTVTSQLAAFGTLEAGFALLTAGLLFQLIKGDNAKAIGAVLAGIGALFIGLWAFGGVAVQFTDTELGRQFVAHMSGHKESAVMYGALFTAIVQSSSAVSSLLVGLADAEVVMPDVAIAGVLGSNIGTVTTTILVALSGGMIARRAAVADLFFNVLSVLVLWPFFNTFVALMGYLSDFPGRQVAHAHTFFNVLGVLVMLPLINPFCRWITRFIR